MLKVWVICIFINVELLQLPHLLCTELNFTSESHRFCVQGMCKFIICIYAEVSHLPHVLCAELLRPYAMFVFGYDIFLVVACINVEA